MTTNPFDALGLPARPDLDDEEVRAAWRTLAAATHPDRPDGGDLARYTAASAAYAELRTGWGRSEAYADLTAADDGPVTTPCPPSPRTPETPRSGLDRRSRGGSRSWPWSRSPPGSAAADRAACSCAPSSPRCWPWPCCS
jgi:hypothetical protein